VDTLVRDPFQRSGSLRPDEQVCVLVALAGQQRQSFAVEDQIGAQ
jgi:hypothetical protein